MTFDFMASTIKIIVAHVSHIIDIAKSSFQH